MTRKLIKSLLICTLTNVGSLSAQPAPAFPSYTEAVSHFFNRYDNQELVHPPSHCLRFCKDEEGWFYILVNTEYNDEEYSARFWSEEEGAYIALPELPVRQTIQTAEINSYLNSPEAQYYELLDVYGYAEWEDDQLDILEDIENPGHEELHKLALTWRLLATYMLGGGSIYLNDDKCETEEGELLDEDDFEDIKEAIDLSLYYYNELIKQSANEKEKQAIQLEYAHGIMQIYLLARQWAESGLAESILPEGLYPAPLLHLAKLQMHNCPDSAILFLYCKKTLLPAIYLQAHETYRTDIALIDYSKLHEPQYRKALNRGSYPFGQIDAHIRTEKRENGTDPAELLAEFHADTSTNFYYCHSYEDIVFTPSQNKKAYSLLYSGIELPPAPALKSYSPYTCTGIDSLNIRLPYELKYGQALLINLAYMPDNQRPLCLSNQIPDRDIYFLDEYLELNGLYYTMSSCYREDSLGVTGHADAHELHMIFKRVKEVLTETGTNGMNQAIARPYRKLALRTAREYLHAGDTAKAKALVDELISLLPDDKVPYGDQMIELAGLAYQTGQINTGDQILRAVYSNYYTKRLLDGRGYERKRMNLLKLTLDQAKRHKRTEFAKELDKTVIY